MNKIKYSVFKNYSIAEMSTLIKNNHLYKQVEHGTRFKIISESNAKIVLPNHSESTICVVDKFSGVLAWSDDKPIGILLFENYKYLETLKNIISHRYKKYSFINKGAIGIYVKEEFRNQDIANNMMRIFNTSFINDYYDEIKKFDLVILSCTSHCFDIASKRLTGIALTRSFGNFNLWKDSIKESLTYRTDYSSFKLIKDLYELGGDIDSIIEKINGFNSVVTLENKLKIKNSFNR